MLARVPHPERNPVTRNAAVVAAAVAAAVVAVVADHVMP
jgi:hypothetical protein